MEGLAFSVIIQHRHTFWAPTTSLYSPTPKKTPNGNITNTTFLSPSIISRDFTYCITLFKFSIITLPLNVFHRPQGCHFINISLNSRIGINLNLIRRINLISKLDCSHKKSCSKSQQQIKEYTNATEDKVNINIEKKKEVNINT